MRRALALAIVVPALALVVPTVSAASACRPAPASVDLPTDHAAGGSTLTATVRLTCRAERRTRVRLAGSAGMSVPASVVVKPRARSATFPVVTEPATSARSGTVVATRRGRSASATLTVDAVAAPVVPTAPVTPPTTPPTTPPVTAPVTPPLTGSGGLVSATIRESAQTRWWRQRVVDLVFDWPMYQPLGQRAWIAMTSSAPEVIGSQYIDVARNPAYYYLAATPPEVDTLVTLTFTLGDSSVTATTLASPLPTEVGGVDLYWSSPLPDPLVGGASVDLRAQLDVPAPSGTWVDVTSDHPEVVPSSSTEFYTEDFWEVVFAPIGPVSEPTTVTLTATVRGTAITDSVTFTVHPGVAAIEAPPQVPLAPAP